jgi:hypothetical protein
MPFARFPLAALLTNQSSPRKENHSRQNYHGKKAGSYGRPDDKMKEVEKSNSRSSGPATGGSLQIVFVVTCPAGQESSLPPGLLKLFVRAEDLPGVFGSNKLAKILAKHCLTPTVKSASRLTLYWIGDVVSVADHLRHGDLVVDFRAGTVARKSPPNDMA